MTRARRPPRPAPHTRPGLAALEGNHVSTMSNLKKAIERLESTRKRVCPIEAMRRWRVDVVKNQVRRASGTQPAVKSIKPSK